MPKGAAPGRAWAVESAFPAGRTFFYLCPRRKDGGLPDIYPQSAVYFFSSGFYRFPPLLSMTWRYQWAESLGVRSRVR